MKFRNFIIVLLAIFMVFALASCKHEPEVKPTPDEPQPAYSEDVIYKLTATKGRNLGWWSADKFVLSFSADAEKVSKGDVLTLKYRSTREITQFNIRNSSNKWIYEQPKKSSGKDYPLPEGFKSEPDADGWITVTFTFGDKWWDGSEISSTTYPSAWRIDFIGEIVTTDVLEVKDIKLTKSDSTVVPLALTQTKVSDTDAYGNILPTFEVTHDATWQESADWVVFFFNGEPGEVDGTPEYERVFNGMAFTRDWTKDDKGVAYPEKEHYTLKLLKGYATNSEEFDPKTPITENTRLYVIYVGDPQQVTFNTGEGGSEVAAKTVEYGTYVARPETDPTNGENLFAGWFADADCTTKFDFENTAITADTIIYAGFGASTAVTFNAENGEEEHTVVNVANGFPVAAIDNPTYGSRIFDGWYLEGAETAYDFSTPVTAAIELHAHWIAATDVTLDLNYTGAPAATTFKAALDVALAANDENLVIEDRIGWFFGGWYTDAACETAYNYETIVTAPFTLYAKWIDGTLYKFVSTIDSVESGIYSNDKFVVYYKGTGAQLANAGDTLSFRFRTTTDLEYLSVRGAANWIKENSSAKHGMTTYETKDDGWTYVTYKFSDKDKDGADVPKDAYWRFDFGSRTIHIGDVLEIQGWAFNGKPLEITTFNVAQKTGEDNINVGESVNPTFSVVEGGAYDWTGHTVSFNMGVGEAIADKPVAYGKTIEQPDDPEVDGYKFLGWFADAEYESRFLFNRPIFDDVTIYAKFEVKSGVTYNITFNPNLAGVDSSVVKVDEGDKVTAMKVGNPGYFLDGWYTAAEGGDKVDLSTYTASKDDELFAHWVAPTKKYVLTATIDTDDGDYPADRFNLRWSTDYCGTIEVGDIVTYKVKSIPAEGSTAVGRSRVRDKYGSNNLCSEATFPAAGEDGWIAMSFTVASVGKGDGLSIDIRKTSGNLAIGDKIEIMAVAVNGKDITLSTSSSSHGVYYGAKPTIEEFSLAE